MEDRMQTPEYADHGRSYLRPIGYSNAIDCGYCKGQGAGKKRLCYYADSRKLTPHFYQNLVDRSWRRSGRLLYRPNPKAACCPHYTVRLDSAQFKPSRDQRQAINRFNRYVLGDGYVKEAARLHPRSREEAKKRETIFDLVERVHEAELTSLPSLPRPAHEFAVTLESDEFTEEKYAVFENYQRVVHKEPPHKIDRAGFRRFLCDSPLTQTTDRAPDGKERRLGSFHQCYRLDGVLIAIGVLDLLPHGVSAVYFAYHDSVHKFNPGKLGAIREIALALEGGYRHWYSGYYIHTCPKMQYKTDYTPQFILNPGTLEWHPLGKDMTIFDGNGYATFPSAENARPPQNGQGTESNGTPVAKSPEDGEEEPSVSSASKKMYLLKSDMPGIPSLEEMRALDMDDLGSMVDDFDEIFSVADYRFWAEATVDKFPSLKAHIAELVAAVGPDLMDKICVDFRDVA